MTGRRRGIRAVLFDRDNTLAVDVPYNGDPALVRPMPYARESIARLRRAGIAVGIVSNQSGIGRGIVTAVQVQAVDRRLQELVGDVDVSLCCPHLPEDGCGCRKPQPGMIRDACRLLDVPADRTVVVGDIGSDVTAAQRAGAIGVLVPTPKTRTEEVRAATRIAPNLRVAVDLVLAEAVPALGAGSTAGSAA